MFVAAWLLYALCYSEGDETWSRDFPGGPVVKTSCLGAWVQIPVEELRSHILRGSARKKKKKHGPHLMPPALPKEKAVVEPQLLLFLSLGLPVGIISSECTRGTPPATQRKAQPWAV